MYMYMYMCIYIYRERCMYMYIYIYICIFIQSFSVPRNREGYIGDGLVRMRFIVPLLRFAGCSQLEQYK